MLDDSKTTSRDRRVDDRRQGDRRQEYIPIDFPDPRGGKDRRIGSRRTGSELKFCSACGKKISGVPTLPAGAGGSSTVRLCADCAREHGVV